MSSSAISRCCCRSGCSGGLPMAATAWSPCDRSCDSIAATLPSKPSRSWATGAATVLAVSLPCTAGMETSAAWALPVVTAAFSADGSRAGFAVALELSGTGTNGCGASVAPVLSAHSLHLQVRCPLGKCKSRRKGEVTGADWHR